MAYVLHQNTRRAAEIAVDAMITQLEGGQPDFPILPVEIITKENILGMAFE